MKQPAIQVPEGLDEVLLHACCAPCSSAIVEWLMNHGVRVTIFYFNPNIWPREEYEIRKNESKRHAENLGIRWIDGDYDHNAWCEHIKGLENEPERGSRCQECFAFRLTQTARKAQELGIRYFATTLASSRWKSLEQIERAGHLAEAVVNGPQSKDSAEEQPNTVCFWAQNWRKGGLQERRNQLLREYNFYNQQYCGCEFSVPSQMTPTKAIIRELMRQEKQKYKDELPAMSAEIVSGLKRALAFNQIIMAYWPLPDEVDIRPLIEELTAQGKIILLPKITGDGMMELRRYTSPADLVEGPFHVMEPVGKPFEHYHLIDVALVPGVAFDAVGHRLGRGKGYYDRFLAAHPRIYKVGVYFPFQLLTSVPFEEHDVRMNA